MIGLIGMSHLGINTSVAFAARGFEVLGFDPNQTLTSDLNKFTYPIFEPGLEGLHREHKQQIRFSSNAQDLQDCDLVYFSFDVPTNTNNESDLVKVRAMIAEFTQALKPGTVLVILSQVPPGFSRSLMPLMHQRKLELYYQVETLVFGQAVDRAMNPERYIVGCADPIQPLPQNFQRLLSAFNCPILPMKLESAELAKISINLYLTSTVTVTNALAEICEKTGAEWSEIAPAMRLDKRIGPHAYLSPGLGLAGGNLERDLVTVQTLSEQHGTESSLVDAWFLNSQYRRDWMLRSGHQLVLQNTLDAKLAVWGLAYKIGTHSLKNAPSLRFLETVKGIRVRTFDPEAKLPQDLKTEFCVQVESPEAAAEGADALLVFTPYSQFRNVDPIKLRSLMAGKTILDPFKILDESALNKAGFQIHSLGRKS